MSRVNSVSPNSQTVRFPYGSLSHREERLKRHAEAPRPSAEERRELRRVKMQGLADGSLQLGTAVQPTKPTIMEPGSPLSPHMQPLPASRTASIVTSDSPSRPPSVVSDASVPAPLTVPTALHAAAATSRRFTTETVPSVLRAGATKTRQFMTQTAPTALQAAVGYAQRFMTATAKVASSAWGKVVSFFADILNPFRPSVVREKYARRAVAKELNRMAFVADHEKLSDDARSTDDARVSAGLPDLQPTYPTPVNVEPKTFATSYADALKSSL